MASSALVAEIAAGTGIHRCEKLESGRKVDTLQGAEDGDFSALQRLPQRFQHGPFEFKLGISNIAEIFQYYFLASVYQRLA